MARGFAPVLFAIVALASVACTRPTVEAHCTDGDSGAAQPPAGGAANAADVSRFADEEPFGPPATIAQDKTRVSTAPGGADVVTTLPAGTDVVKLAGHGTDALVCFDDPKPGGKHLMGWVPLTALQDPAPPPAPGPAADDGGAPPDPPPPRGKHHHKRRRH
jgi:hypothetical protein